LTWNVNRTHAPELRSWVDSANGPATDFPIQNLPFGVFRRRDSKDAPRVGVAIGSQIVDPAAAGVTSTHSDLNALMALGNDAAHALRLALSELLRHDSPDRARAEKALTPMADCELLLPARIGDYTDFYASIQHATNVGRLFRPDNPLVPNYKYVPIGYHGRASSIVVSGTPIARPLGQARPSQNDPPLFRPSQRLDYEMELGFFVACGNSLGTPVPIREAADRVFGFCLLNDWSARDIQSWEYQPLGPFLSKSFATTISPWVVTAEALAPFRTAAYARPEGDPAPLEYLSEAHDQQTGGFDITLEAWIETVQMREKNLPSVRLSRANFRDMYWTVAQMLAHHTSNGCNLRSADLLGSGTVSGEAADARGCLLELTRAGSEPIQLPDGEMRRFLEDGDQVILRGRCEREGWTPIGFGECRGAIIPPPPEAGASPHQ
jgi:fumarylacetoacetase